MVKWSLDDGRKFEYNPCSILRKHTHKDCYEYFSSVDWNLRQICAIYHIQIHTNTITGFNVLKLLTAKRDTAAHQIDLMENSISSRIQSKFHNVLVYLPMTPCITLFFSYSSSATVYFAHF